METSNEQPKAHRPLWQLCAEYERLPYGVSRVSAVQEALALAEQLNTPYYRLAVRYDLIWALAIEVDPAKALPVCAEFFALLEEYPGVLKPEETRRDAICTAMMAAYIASTLPQISLRQYQSFIEQFHDQVKRYGKGERSWQMHASYFSLTTGDPTGAEAHLGAFWEAPRDDFSDCVACEASNAAEILLDLGYREEAQRVLQPALDGVLTCEQQPRFALSVLINDALEHGEFDKAKQYGRRLTQYTLDRVQDLPYMGSLLCLWAHTAENCPTSLLEKGIGLSIGVWDQGLLFAFYKGAWKFCTKLSEQTDIIPLSLPGTFPLYQKEGRYHCSGLARWFYEQAETIAQRFDQRNGSDFYGRKLQK